MSAPLVHIGFPKAASTWLQAHLFSNPQLGLRSPFTENRVKNALVRPDGLDFDPAEARERFGSKLEEVSAQGLVPVLSAERLCGNHSSGGFDTREIAERLAAVLPDARVLIVIREQRAMLVSMYKQYVGRGGSASFHHFLKPRLNRMRLPLMDWRFLAYDRIARCYGELFGLGKVSVVPFELLLRDPRDLAARITSFASAQPQPGAIEALPYARGSNVSSSALAVSLMRPLNALFAWDRNRDSPPAVLPMRGPGWRLGQGTRRVQSAIKALDARAPAGLRGRLDRRLREQVDREVGDAYHESNRRTSALSGIDLAGFGYGVAAAPGDAVPAGERVLVPTA
jgi:Sulfotransferase family